MVQITRLHLRAPARTRPDERTGITSPGEGERDTERQGRGGKNKAGCPSTLHRNCYLSALPPGRLGCRRDAQSQQPLLQDYK